jgi:hypothetical protein
VQRTGESGHDFFIDHRARLPLTMTLDRSLEPRMADEETKQLLREIQASLKEQLEIMRGTNGVNAATQKQNDEQIRLVTERYEKQAQDYDRAAARYEESIRTTTTASNIANIIRSLALLGIAAVLAYLVFFGLHNH